LPAGVRWPAVGFREARRGRPRLQLAFSTRVLRYAKLDGRSTDPLKCG